MAVRVLVVEDLPEVRTLVGLEVRRHQELELVGEAATGAEGVRMAAELRPDVVVLDLKMPDTSDRDLYEWVREASDASRVVVFTAYDEDRPWYEARGVRVVAKEEFAELIGAVAAQG